MPRRAESGSVRAKKAAVESNDWRGRDARESRGASICTEEGATITKKQERIVNKQKENGTRPGGCAAEGVEEVERTGEVLWWIK
jgi:hypothetical protein